MKIKEFLKVHHGVAKGELEIFLSDVLNMTRTEIVLREDRVLNKNELSRLEKMVKERKTGKPVAYILGKKEFYGRDFCVDENVLIPRPETETIIDVVKEIVKQFKKVRIVDVGAGSGCIAVTLGLELGEKAEVLAIDKSSMALKVAKKNAQKLGTKITFLKSDLLRSAEGDFDVVVANLPYVDRRWDWLDQNSLGFEPEIALYAENEGLALIYELVKQASGKARFLVLEVDPCQHEKIIDYAKNYGFQHTKTDGFIVVLSALQV